MAKKNKRLLITTGGGDCPGLNAVIRGLCKRAQHEGGWTILGSVEAYTGVLKDPIEVVELTNEKIAGIHVKGGTILRSTTKGGPFTWPVLNPDGTWVAVDRSDELIKRLKDLKIDAVVSIGGDGSQKISQKLFEKGVNIVGVPKTIDNDLSSTDFSFGFQTAVQIATDSFDKIVTTSESHNRVIIIEVMGRNAGWIALYTAVAGGAEVCLIPEIPYDINEVVRRIENRYVNGRGFANIVVAEGARPVEGTVVARKSDETGYENLRLGGIAHQLTHQMKGAGCKADIREAVLGHVQRGGSPNAFDRVLALQFGVKAFEMVLAKEFGKLVTYKNNDIVTVPIKNAIAKYNYVNPKSYLVKAAKGLGISFGN
ncbi:MAG: ATP-dependent 6-phosphofructokinase [Bacteroidetes bacterium]|nr:ATP-dependent 6-phosphofructokinase [Bacteroidota bacterium]MDA1119869.1 ATP-dependent 6-phosphofructokinase [Bacteroidota bacterium]